MELFSPKISNVAAASGPFYAVNTRINIILQFRVGPFPKNFARIGEMMADNQEQKVDAQQTSANNCVENGTTNGTRGSGEGENIEDQPEREITQTDHLNKRLLDSFLQRLNQSGSNIPAVERISTSDTEEDFETDNAQISDNNKSQ